MRWRPDDVDMMWAGWAATRKQIQGLHENLQPREVLGRLKCTLGSVRDEAEGAGQPGVVNQKFPEVYTGIALTVHRCWMAMPVHDWKLVTDAHYVWNMIPVRLKAPALGLAEAKYYQHLTALKVHTRSYVASNADGFVPRRTASGSFVRYF